MLKSFSHSSCILHGITFSSQDAIDNFQVNYPGCVEILGDMFIRDDFPNTITNLSGLHTDNLQSLKGLENFDEMSE